VDGASGILQCLGVQFLDVNRRPLENLPQDLVSLGHIDITNLDKQVTNIDLVILCDVDNLLLGKNGAAEVFGPQKGASESDIKKLDAALKKFRDITFTQKKIDIATIKSGGAAGGTAAGLSAFFGAKLVNGIEYFLDITSFDEALDQADLVITGEGSIDVQTLQGKAPFGVARRAKEKNIRVIAIAGHIPLEPNSELQQYFDVLMPINNGLTNIDEALRNTGRNLERTGEMIGNLLAAR